MGMQFVTIFGENIWHWPEIWVTLANDTAVIFCCKFFLEPCGKVILQPNMVLRCQSSSQAVSHGAVKTWNVGRQKITQIAISPSCILKWWNLWWLTAEVAGKHPSSNGFSMLIFASSTAEYIFFRQSNSIRHIWLANDLCVLNSWLQPPQGALHLITPFVKSFF